jgi:hypothetical protein
MKLMSEMRLVNVLPCQQVWLILSATVEINATAVRCQVTGFVGVSALVDSAFFIRLYSTVSEV